MLAEKALFVSPGIQWCLETLGPFMTETCDVGKHSCKTVYKVSR
jgi:hypothetical protein